MPRQLYTLFLYLLLPFIPLRLLWRARKQPAYLNHVGERFGRYPALPIRARDSAGILWVHAVSVGETRAAQPLIEALLKDYPDHTVLLTGMTPTGRDTGAQVYGDRVIQAYLPYDYPGAVGCFFRHFHPRLGILMETELWPNLLQAAQNHQIPMLLCNARLSQRSARGYQRFSGLTGPAFRALSGVAAQSEADAQRLTLLGASPVTVCGNLKFDVPTPADKIALGTTWKEQAGQRKVWLAASTREGEEALILDALRAAPLSNALLVLVPRHPQRFAEVAALAESKGFTVGRRSAGLPAADTDIWLGDSMGEMVAYYTMADVAFIGGSLLPLGGQNLIEAAACGCPVLIGPHTFNFAEATEQAITAGAAQRVADAPALIAAIKPLLASPPRRNNMAYAATQFAAAHRGATARTMALVRGFIGRCSGPARR